MPSGGLGALSASGTMRIVGKPWISFDLVTDRPTLQRGHLLEVVFVNPRGGGRACQYPRDTSASSWEPFIHIHIYIYIYIYLCNSDCKAHKSREIDSKSQKSLRGSRTVAKMQPPKRIEC